jgi:hypothetical protein
MDSIVYPQGPLVYSQTLLNTNQTIYMNVFDQLRTINSDIFTNDIIVMTGSTISGLTLPINDTDAANKEYVDSKYTLSVSTVPYSVQIKFNTSTMTGSPLLTFQNGTLFVDTILKNGPSTLNGPLLTGLYNPTVLDGACTKQYADRFSKKTVSQIASLSSVQYTAAQVVNGIIIRTGLNLPVNDSTGLQDISIRNVDLFPSAQQIFTYLSSLNITATIGFTFTFNILNKNSNSSVSLIIRPVNETVTFSKTDIVIYGSYQMTARIIVTGTVIPSVFVHIDTNGPVNGTSQSTIYNKDYTLGTIMRSNYLTVLPAHESIITTSEGYTYTYEDLKGSIMTRTMNNNVSDTLTVTNELIETNYIKFVIKNVSNYVLTLLNVGDPIEIPSNKSAMIMYNNDGPIVLGLYNLL